MDAVPLAGGRALNTPFGTFYSPNITPDRDTGIGDWSLARWRMALREGRAPDGRHYYPSFPYTSYTRLRDADLRDMKAYLDSLEPASNIVSAHRLDFPFDQRWLMGAWKWMYFSPGGEPTDSARDPQWQRGEYLVNALGHCGECHTPRNLLGALDRDRTLQGNDDGPEGEAVPSLSRDNGGLADWQVEDLVLGLQIGMNLEGGFLFRQHGRGDRACHRSAQRGRFARHRGLPVAPPKQRFEGTLDTPISQRPTAQIFAAAKAEWGGRSSTSRPARGVRTQPHPAGTVNPGRATG